MVKTLQDKVGGSSERFQELSRAYSCLSKEDTPRMPLETTAQTPESDDFQDRRDVPESCDDQA